MGKWGEGYPFYYNIWLSLLELGYIKICKAQTLITLTSIASFYSCKINSINIVPKRKQG
jgi:hypothetical protein